MKLMLEAAEADPYNLRVPTTLGKLLMRHGRYTDADRMLRSLPSEVQDEPEISNLLAHLGFILATHEAPPMETLERTLSEDPDDAEARYQLSALKLMQDDYEGAMEQLLELVRRNRAYGDDIARKGLMAIFSMLGNDSSLTKRYRARMFNAIH